MRKIRRMRDVRFIRFALLVRLEIVRLEIENVSVGPEFYSGWLECPAMSSLVRHFSAALLFACTVSVFPAAAQQVQYSSLHRNSEHALPQTVTGGTKAARARLAGARSGISLAVADFDGDSVRDLVTGYGHADGTGSLMLQRGNPAATAPGPHETAMLAAGQFVAPYVAKAELITVPVHPDLLESADVSGYGHQDLLVAAKGGSTVYLLAGKGDGTFLPAQPIAFAGPVTALKVWRGPTGQNLLVASVCSATGCGLQVVAADGKVQGFAPTPGKVSSFEIAPLNGGQVQDVLAITDGKALLVDGDSLLAGTPDIQTVMNHGAVAATSGLFTYNLDGGMQLAVLGADATVHFFSRTSLNTHELTHEEFVARRHALTAARGLPVTHIKFTGVAWLEVETVPNFGPGASAGETPVFLHGHISGNGTDDLVLMAKGQYLQLTHTVASEGGRRVSTPVVLVDSTTDAVTAAVATRIAADSRLGVITLGGNQPQLAQQSGLSHHHRDDDLGLRNDQPGHLHRLQL